MTIEDLLIYMLQIQYDFTFTDWEAKFIRSVGMHPMNDRALSTRQGESVIRIGKKYRTTLFSRSEDMKKLEILLSNPTYRNEPFVSEIYPREVRYAGDNFLAFRFKMNEEVKSAIKALSPQNSAGQTVFFAKGPKVWVVPVTLSNVSRVQDVIAACDFNFDDPVLTLLANVASSHGVPPQAFYDADRDQIVLAASDDAVLAWFAEHVLGGISH